MSTKAFIWYNLTKGDRAKHGGEYVLGDDGIYIPYSE